MSLRAAVLVFPGSNCDRDLAVALRRAGAEVEMVWHKDSSLPAGVDLVAIPGGFSFGDYLRCGAIAARSKATARSRSQFEPGKTMTPALRLTRSPPRSSR